MQKYDIFFNSLSKKENVRKFVRFNTFLKLEALLFIVTDVDNNSTFPKPTTVVLEDISANGLAFLSNLDFPLNEEKEITVKMNFKLMGVEIERYGTIVRLENRNYPWKYLYGLYMKSTEREEDKLYKLLVSTGSKFENVTTFNSTIWKGYKK